MIEKNQKVEIQIKKIPDILFIIVILLSLSVLLGLIFEKVFGVELELFIIIYILGAAIFWISSKLLVIDKERKKAEIEIAASQKIFSTVFYQSPVMNTITDASNGKYVKVNDNFARFCGYNKEELIGKSSLELNLIPHPKHREEMIKTILETGFLKDVLIEVQGKNRECLWVSTSAHQVNINGKDCYLTAMIDVTERKKAEEQLQEVNNMLNSFSYTVSHDLRAPLRHINGFIELFRNNSYSKLDDKEKRYINIITSSATKMGNLIEGLLAFSRLGNASVTKKMVEMNSLVFEVLENLKSEIIQKGKQEEKARNVDWLISSLPDAEADSEMLKLVWINLISNALKYSSKIEKPKIEIGANISDSKTVFFVRDYGAGFDMKYEKKLFGVFQRLHTTEEFEGIGIGLANVKRIIEKHGGEIWAEGKINQGATFYFTLPA